MQYDLSAHTEKFDEVGVFRVKVGKPMGQAAVQCGNSLMQKFEKVWQVISSFEFEYLACESIQLTGNSDL